MRLDRSRSRCKAITGIGGTQVAKGMEGGSEKLTELLETLAKVNAIDLNQVAKAAEDAKSVQQKFMEELSKGKALSRKAPRKRRQHWKTKRRLQREYHANIRKPRNAVAKAELLRQGGWFALLKKGWDKAGVPVEVTAEEWNEAVGSLVDHVPVVGRYDTSLGVRLDNVIVRSRDSGEVLFDGKEWLLRSSGYIL